MLADAFADTPDASPRYRYFDFRLCTLFDLIAASLPSVSSFYAMPMLLPLSLLFRRHFFCRVSPYFAYFAMPPYADATLLFSLLAIFSMPFSLLPSSLFFDDCR